MFHKQHNVATISHGLLQANDNLHVTEVPRDKRLPISLTVLSHVCDNECLSPPFLLREGFKVWGQGLSGTLRGGDSAVSWRKNEPA